MRLPIFIFFLLRVKLNSRCFIRDGVISIIFTEVKLKLYFFEVVDIVFDSEFTCTCTLHFL